MADNSKLLREKALTIHQRLLEEYGTPENRDPLDPISELVCTILSQHTSDVNRDRAFHRLRERFPSWEEVIEAPTEQIIDAIRPAGLAQQKAPRIKEALECVIREHGELSLDFLRDMSVTEAKQWLTRIKGIGPKTAAIILLFSLQMPAFPVDTHVHRVAKRLALISPGVSADKAHDILEAMIPPDIYYTFHINLIRHGRAVCKAPTPRCEACMLTDLCDHHARQR